MVTIQPLRSSNSSSRGIAVISFDLVSTATWPSVSRASQAQALTRCSGFLPAAVSNEPRSVLPSMATTSPATAAPAASSHCWMQAINWAGSRRAKTRPKVSCEGIPLGKSRNVRKKSSLALLKRSMSAQPLALPKVAQTARMMMSSKVCRWVRSSRGSVRPAKNGVKSSATSWVGIRHLRGRCSKSGVSFGVPLTKSIVRPNNPAAV